MMLSCGSLWNTAPEYVMRSARSCPQPPASTSSVPRYPALRIDAMAAMYESRHTVLSAGPHSLAMLMIWYLSSGVQLDAADTPLATTELSTAVSVLQLVAVPAAVDEEVGMGTSFSAMCCVCTMLTRPATDSPYSVSAKIRTVFAPLFAIPAWELES